MARREHRYRDFAPRIDIERFLEGTGLLGEHVEKENKRGETELIGQCPDCWGLHKHGDSTGKFALNVDKRVYNCFVCGGGSLLDLVMALWDMDVDQALDWLIPLADDATKTDDEWMDDIDRLLGQLHRTAEPEEVLPYFNPRVLSRYDVYEENLRSWNAGEYDGRPKNIHPEVLHHCGVRYALDATKYAPRNRAGEPIDVPYVGPCVIFPHFVGDRLVGWQSRWLSDARPKWVPKYTNTPDFPKRSTLFQPEDYRYTPLPVIVCESVPTALFILGLGWPAIATFGAQATPEQLKLLRRFQQGVIIAPDNDKPGVEALIAMADYLDGFIPVSYIEPDGPTGADLMDRQDEDVVALLHGAVRVT